MAIVVVGDINVDEIEKKIKNNFSQYKNPSKPRERKSFDLPNHQEALVAIETDPDATGSGVQFIIKDSEVYQPDITVQQYDHSVAERLVNMMLNSRLAELVNSVNPPLLMVLFITEELLQEIKKHSRDQLLQKTVIS